MARIITAKAMQLAVRLGLLALLVYWTFHLIRPYVPILAWSIVLAVALSRIRLLARLPACRPRLAAAIVIGPATWLGLSALDWVRDFAENLALAA
jgi:predicted PurR-regulated permease PerM